MSDRPPPDAVDQAVRIGVVGLGYWGPNLVRNLHELPEAEVVAVADPRPEAIEKVTRRYPAVRATAQLADLLADPSIDAIVISTPISTHYELAKAALEAGRHVFVEKPLATSAKQALHLVELAEAKNLVLMPGHTFLYSPPVNMVRDLIVSGELGSIYSISTSRVNLGLHQSDASVVWDLGPHDFSILRYWLDEMPTHVSAISRGCIIPTTPDVAFINLEFATGTIANVELSWLAPSKLRRTTVIGSQKMVVYDDVNAEPVRIFDSGVMLKDPETFGEYRLTYRTGDIVSPRVEIAEPLLLEMADFCASIQTGAVPRSSPEVGVDVVRITEAVDMSLEENSRRIEIAAPELVLD
jgi:predicted dehydrogenase